MEVKAGMKLKINKSIVTVIQVSGGFAILKTQAGCQYCYGLSGIRESMILIEEIKPGTQLSLI